MAPSNPCIVLTCEIFSKDLSFSFFSWKSEGGIRVNRLNAILLFVLYLQLPQWICMMLFFPQVFVFSVPTFYIHDNSCI